MMVVRRRSIEDEITRRRVGNWRAMSGESASVPIAAVACSIRIGCARLLVAERHERGTVDPLGRAMGFSAEERIRIRSRILPGMRVVERPLGLNLDALLSDHDDRLARAVRAG